MTTTPSPEALDDEIQSIASIYVFDSLGDRDRAVACMNALARRHRLAFSRPEPVGNEALVERVARAIHEHLSRRDIMAYLNNEEDCEGLARAAIQAIPAPATDAGQSADSLVWALREIEAAWASNNAEGDDYDEGFDDGLKRACEIAREALAEWTASLPKSPSAGEG